MLLNALARDSAIYRQKSATLQEPFSIGSQAETTDLVEQRYLNSGSVESFPSGSGRASPVWSRTCQTQTKL